MRIKVLAVPLWLAAILLAMPAPSMAALVFSVVIAPPPLPVYEQPLCPGDGYLWTPSYWDSDVLAAYAVEAAYVRLRPDHRRAILWRALWKFHFSRYISKSDCVLDLGSGYGDFINSVRARRRIALDHWPGHLKYLADGVEGHAGATRHHKEKISPHVMSCQVTPTAIAEAWTGRLSVLSVLYQE